MTTSPTQAALLAALKAIVSECRGCPPDIPYSIHSYLPPHLLAGAQAAIALAEGGAA